MSSRFAFLDSPAAENAVPMSMLQRIADAQAAEVWGEPVGRGTALPLSDGRGVHAYVFPYALGAPEFPPTDAIFSQIRELRATFGVTADSGEPPSEYREALSRLGRRFGAVCVSATTNDPPIPWLTHFLPTFFITAEWAAEAAERHLGAEFQVRRYIYNSPEGQYLEFAAGQRTVLIDAVDPRRDVPADPLAGGDRGPHDDRLVAAIQQAWARVPGPSTAAGILRGAPDIPGDAVPGAPSLIDPAAVLMPGVPVEPRGVPMAEIGATSTTKKIPNWELIPKVDHTTHNWCVPSSWAMVLGFYDNYVPGKGTLLGYGRWIDHWYELTPGGANLPNLVDDVLPPHDAQTINGYHWTTTPTLPSGDNEAAWQALKAEVDAGRPSFFSTVEHTTAVFGYRIAADGQRFAIVYDPPNPNVPTYEAEYNILKCNKEVCAVVVSGGTDNENLVLISPDGGETRPTGAPAEITWFVWGNSIQRTRLSVSIDAGNTWTVVAAQIPTKGAWNGYAWLPGAAGNRVRVKVEGLTGTDQLIAADGSYKNLQVTTSPATAGWAQVWGPTGTVLVGSVPGTPEPVVYATHKPSGDLYRKDPSSTGWTKVGGPGKMFVLDDSGHLYGLSPDGGGVFRYDGTPMVWTQIGGPSAAIYAGGGSLFATNPQTGDLYQYANIPMAWTKVGGPGKSFAVDGKGRLYGISPTGGAIYRWEGKPMQWAKIGDQAISIHAGGSGLWAVRGPHQDLYLYSLAGTLWTKAGGPGKMFAVDDDGRAFGLSPTGDAVFQYDGTWDQPERWAHVGDAAGAIYAGGSGRIYATNPATGDLWARTSAKDPPRANRWLGVTGPVRDRPD